MLANFINRLASMTTNYRALLTQVDEFHKLNTIVNQTQCGFVLDATGKIIEINELLLKTLNYKKSDLLNQPHRILVGEDDAKAERYIGFWRDLEALKLKQGQFKLKNKSGNDLWFDGYYAPVKNAEGKQHKVVAYMRLASSHQHELALNQDNALRMQAALENASAAVMAVDRDLVVTYVNDATRTLFRDHILEFQKAFPGFHPEQIVGMCIDAFHRNPQHQRTLLAEPSNLPYTTVIKVGRLNIRLHITASFDAAGKYIGNILEWRDVTQEMSDAGQLAAISKVMGIIEFDLQGNILFVNDNFASITGYDKKAMIGQNHRMLVPATFASSDAYKTFWDQLRHGEYHRGRHQRIGKAGQEIWLEASYNPILDKTGKPFKVVKYASEITQVILKEREDIKRNTEALLIKNALDSASINVMVANNDGIIQYINPSALKLMQASVATFSSIIPNFDANTLLGSNFDIFHKNPAHQRQLLSGLKTTYSTELRLGNLYFKLSASPLFTEAGDRLGTVLEWQNTTEEKQVESEIKTIVENAVAGDLSQRLKTDGRNGNLQKTMDGLNQLLDAISQVMTQVQEAVGIINNAAGEISSGNTDLSKRTEQQAAALEEIASSMEELSSTVKQNAENAKQANQFALDASAVALKGGEAFVEVVSTMSAIQESSKQIEDIISVIDGIAFQTNILALNAAVEAARAGEQGRGFAVVAGEVRNLAQRSASAAKEIKALISDSAIKVTTGTQLVENAGATMKEIVFSVQRVTDIMGEITDASQEQSTGIDHVNIAITSLDDTTQHNAALVEQAAAASIALVEQAEKLNQSMSTFRVSAY